ncbi:hypothetical protein IW150_002864 [Coemansia sp. RSA 2607]|nr:hypothetical protein IW150_002864 [Coemansia sp. RSA 2607]
MSMQPAKETEKTSQPRARRAGGAAGSEDRDEKQPAGRLQQEVLQPKPPGDSEAPQMEAARRVDDSRMVNMERRMDDMCVLLERLMAVRTADQYYMATGGSPTPVGNAGRYGYQEQALYSTPSGAYRDQALYMGETGDAPEDSHGAAEFGAGDVPESSKKTESVTVEHMRTFMQCM